jgi:hypothetical protein
MHEKEKENMLFEDLPLENQHIFEDRYESEKGNLESVFHCKMCKKLMLLNFLRFYFDEKRKFYRVRRFKKCEQHKVSELVEEFRISEKRKKQLEVRFPNRNSDKPLWECHHGCILQYTQKELADRMNVLKKCPFCYYIEKSIKRFGDVFVFNRKKILFTGVRSTIIEKKCRRCKTITEIRLSNHLNPGRGKITGTACKKCSLQPRYNRVTERIEEYCKENNLEWIRK